MLKDEPVVDITITRSAGVKVPTTGTLNIAHRILNDAPDQPMTIKVELLGESIDLVWYISRDTPFGPITEKVDHDRSRFEVVHIPTVYDSHPGDTAI